MNTNTKIALRIIAAALAPRKQQGSLCPEVVNAASK